MNEMFRQISNKISHWVGTPAAFAVAVLGIVAWAMCGPLFHFSDTWQLVINTTTTIITFLMVFLIQNTQNRDARAIHLKLDELIRANTGARNSLIDLEEMSDELLDQVHEDFKASHENITSIIEEIEKQKEKRTKD
ncbi:low affinity iron permease family protein [Bdellovibrio sp. ZAP7]|uniref:low affinity iron permease family protein n=1 Tax=Bdellovibrio sp. ZAP7 TaxID=2231053 RepID=UPI00115B5338|nr:low affinity iron permease family protein [Bdellovibrio sp. ZAP7]QDK45061.1 low affinity iron permease family protein [Bdellovibrio sp. ZAP7]